MISDERLELDHDMLGKDALMEIFRSADSSMVQELALRLLKAEKELLVLRKAFSEPVVWALEDELEKAMKVNGDGMMCGFGYVTKDWTATDTIFLYRKTVVPPC